MICAVSSESAKKLKEMPGVVEVAPAKDFYYVTVDDQEAFVKALRLSGNDRAIQLDSVTPKLSFWQRIFGAKIFQ